MSVRAATSVSVRIHEPRVAGAELASEALGKLSLGKQSVGILFASIELDLPELLAGLRASLDIPIVGCTTYGEATSAGYTEASATLLILTTDDGELGIGLGEGLVTRREAAVADAWEQASAKLTLPPRLVLVFPDAALTACGEVVVDALNAKLGGKVPVMGGCPGDGGRFKKTFQFFEDRVVSDSVPMIVIADASLDPIVITRTGWEPVGHRGIATKVSGTDVVEIDHRPAVEFLGRYITQLDDPEVLATFPIALFPEGDTSERFILRSPFFYNKETGAVTYGGLIPEGSTVQVGRAFRDRVLESAEDAARTAITRAGGRKPSCVLFASCGGRKMVLGAKLDREIALLVEQFGADTPIAGFYSYAEIGPFDSHDAAASRARYHNCTLVVCAF